MSESESDCELKGDWKAIIDGKGHLVTKDDDNVFLDGKPILTGCKNYNVWFIHKYNKIAVEWNCSDPPDVLWIIPLADLMTTPIHCPALDDQRYLIENFFEWSKETTRNDDFLIHGTGHNDQPYLRIIDLKTHQVDEWNINFDKPINHAYSQKHNPKETLEIVGDLITLTHGDLTFKATWINKQLTAVTGSIDPPCSDDEMDLRDE